MYKVTKKDGTSQDFDRSKIVNALKNAGATEEVSEGVASEVDMWLPEVAMEGSVGYQELKDKVYELLAMKDIDSAQRFQNFKKS